MPPVLRRPRPVSPRLYAQDQNRTTSSFKCSRLVLIFLFLSGFVYFVVEFRGAVQTATQKMGLRSPEISTVNTPSYTSLNNLNPQQQKSIEHDDDDNDDNEEDDAHDLPGVAAEGEEEEEEDKGNNKKEITEEDNGLATTEDENEEDNNNQKDSNNQDDTEIVSPLVPESIGDEGEEEKDEEEQPNDEKNTVTIDERIEQAEKVEEEEEQEEETTEEEIKKETSTVEESPPLPEGEEEEKQLDEGQIVVDENAHDVVVEEVDPETEAIEEKHIEAGPVLLPKYTREELEEKGFGHLLYAYRVVASNVAVRTKPSPIGALAGTTKDKGGLTKDSHKQGDVVVGYRLSKTYGLWLKLAPYTWMPITKKESTTAPFHPVMKQIRKISLPGNLRRYWRMKKTDCTVYKREDSKTACEEKNMIRDGVLQVMRRMKLMDSTMDPDIHPFISQKSKKEVN